MYGTCIKDVDVDVLGSLGPRSGSPMGVIALRTVLRGSLPRLRWVARPI